MATIPTPVERPSDQATSVKIDGNDPAVVLAARELCRALHQDMLLVDPLPPFSNMLWKLYRPSGRSRNAPPRPGQRMAAAITCFTNGTVQPQNTSLPVLPYSRQELKNAGFSVQGDVLSHISGASWTISTKAEIVQEAQGATPGAPVSETEGTPS